MKHHTILSLVFLLSLGLLSVCSGESPESYLLQTHSLPADLNFMPSLANGHVGYTVFGDAIFMNGVYNGAGGNSQRARLPNWLNISAAVCDLFGCLTDQQLPSNGTLYEMDLRDGYFRYSKNFSTAGITLEQRTYPHRYYNRALVYEVVAKKQAGSRVNAPLFLKLTQQPGNESDAFNFTVLNNGSSQAGDYRVLHGRTKILEFEPIQSKPHEVYVLFSEWLEQSLRIHWPVSQSELRYRIIVTMDTEESVARKELQDVLALDDAALLQSHAMAWHSFWDYNFSIEIDGDLELWRIINAGIFYLASSLPSLTSNQENGPFFGLSPTGLARGNLEADYQGHNFWDTEIWMLPLATQFHFKYARALFDYRIEHLEGARYFANATGYKGARFPWESAYTGIDVTNPCCPEVANQEIHISPDIIFAMGKFYAQSQDKTFLCQKAWPMAMEVAEFLMSRVSCNETEQLCHLLDVMGPDEDHPNVNDNVYTNVVSKNALEFAEWSTGVCGNESDAELVESWRNVSDRLVVLYDEKLDYHPQHEGYQINTTVKQADTILIGYPLGYEYSYNLLNDLNYYVNATRESGPAMTWSMFATNYLRTAERERADEYFERGYKSYVRPEFKVWSETPIGHEGSANFLTGIGGFLQSLIYGYGGINFKMNGDTPTVVQALSEVPPNVTRVYVKYIQFGYNNCTLEFKYRSTRWECKPSFGQRSELIQGKQRTLLTGDFTVTLKDGDEPIEIRAL